MYVVVESGTHDDHGYTLLGPFADKEQADRFVAILPEFNVAAFWWVQARHLAREQYKHLGYVREWIPLETYDAQRRYFIRDPWHDLNYLLDMAVDQVNLAEAVAKEDQTEDQQSLLRSFHLARAVSLLLVEVVGLSIPERASS